MTTHDEMQAVEAVAESWASIDGRLGLFRSCKVDPSLEDVEGRYGGYMADAYAMVENLRRRGFTVCRAAGGADADPEAMR